jgi:two-component system alkaline phosphatase synthesis response regulator PhoP
MPKKILIVDDELFIRALLEQTLEDLTDAGVELLSTGTGKEAWRLVQAERPDLVLLDIMLPDISGYEVCERIKGTPELASTHVIVLTAMGQAVDRQRSFEAGADEYIAKPFDTKHLVECISDVLHVTV